MRFVLALLLASLVVLPESEAWPRLRLPRIRIRLPRIRVPRIRIRIPKVMRVLDKAGKIYTAGKVIIGLLGKRDVGVFDLNNDGVIDEFEAEQILEKRDVNEVLTLADDDGDSKVSVEEFQEAIQQLTQRAIDLGEFKDGNPEN